MKYAYTAKDPNTAYITNNLLLPKSAINARVIKAALTFITNEAVPVIDEETGEVVGEERKTIKLWDETNTHLVVPREFLTEDQYADFPCDFVAEPMPKFAKVKIGDRITLRDAEQEEAFNAVINSVSGTLNLACGRGKTVIALKALAHFGVPAIVVLNSTFLLEQWKAEIATHLDVKSVGIVQGNDISWKGHPITLAMIHTLAGRRDKWTQEFRRHFGVAVYDESHHMSAPIFVKGADLFYGMRVSLTATANRTDGLEVIYQYHLGRITHTNLKQDLIPKTIFHKLKWVMPPWDKKQVEDRNESVSTARVKTYLGRQKWRNDLINKLIEKDLKDGRQILVLSHSVKHLIKLHEYTKKLGAGLIIGDVEQSSRVAILNNSNPVYGIFVLAREALNKKSLDTLYVTTPFSNANDLQQAWGRIQRDFQGKQEPLVRVFEDTAFENCLRACTALRRELKEKKYPFERELTMERK